MGLSSPTGLTGIMGLSGIVFGVRGTGIVGL